MEVRNEAEAVVGREVRRRERRGAERAAPSLLSIHSWFSRDAGAEPAACTCPLCATDAIALALTKLPPCYSRSQNFGLAAQRIDPIRVRSAVEIALERVTRRPLHPPRQRRHDAGGVRLVDFCLEAGTRMIEPLLRRHEGLCLCLDCREDTLAYALNRVSPKYGVEILGTRRMPPHLMDFIRHDLADAIVKAARVVAANPRH
ncbi:MAG TPA: late competence development ComFB family protein [bacterium]